MLFLKSLQRKTHSGVNVENSTQKQHYFLKSPPERKQTQQQMTAPKPMPQRPPKKMRVADVPEKQPDKEAVVEKEREVPSIEQPRSGEFELNPLMSKMLEEELQDIMIKVWQELPDNPFDPAEKMVVERFRNAAGDHLRNVLGLNVTKRLLHVFNPLYVKVHFSGKPEKVHLSAFLKKYRFNAFKRIESAVNTFAAQVRSIVDFDRVCAARDIQCGNITVTVTPCYKFGKCPPNLKTPYNDDDEEAGTNPDMEGEVKQDIEDEKKIKEDGVKTKSRPIIEPDKDVANSKEGSKVQEHSITKKENDNKTTKEDKNNIEVKKTEPIKNKPIDVGNKTANEITVKENKSSAVKHETVATKEKNDEAGTTGQGPKTKQATQTKLRGTKNKLINTPVKTAIAKETGTNQNEKVEKHLSDYDELDDHDILALMSEGIVLDECSGSDIE